MNLSIPKVSCRSLALRYMGAAGWQPDAGTEQLLTKAEALLTEAATPRGCWRALPLTALELQNAGADLARHLHGCHSMMLMATTLGTGVDALLHRLEITDIALAATADALASAMIEEVCNELEAKMRAQSSAQNQYLTGRYAPGYGDCPIALQDTLCLALDTVRGIGLAVTPQHLLTPRKSVTAILGVADHPVKGALAGCAHCLLREKCQYRKKGITCAD